MSRQTGVISRAAAAVALAGALCGVVAVPASAHSREAITIATSGTITGPTTASGTFTSKVGRFEDSGTYTETYTLVGDEINAEKVLTGRRGAGGIATTTEGMARIRGDVALDLSGDAH
jgi:hypothetical protein